jgi:hypothetical protein
MVILSYPSVKKRLFLPVLALTVVSIGPSTNGCKKRYHKYVEYHYYRGHVLMCIGERCLTPSPSCADSENENLARSERAKHRQHNLRVARAREPDALPSALSLLGEALQSQAKDPNTL